VCLIILLAVPAFMLRVTGVMDDSVFWVVGKALDSGRVLYRDIYFTQPPLFIFIPQLLWKITSNIFVHRAALLGIWLLNGWLFYTALYRASRSVRLALTGIFLSSAFILQSYALHTEIFIVTAFLIGLVAIERDWPASTFVLGLTTSAALFFKPLGPLVFLPAAYTVLLPLNRRRVVWFAFGVAVPCAGMLAYLAPQQLLGDFWQQAILDNGNVGLSPNPDLMGYVSLAIAPLLVPAFVALIAVDTRWRQPEWWLTIALFAALLGLELLRGARHYGLLNLCLVAWLAVRSQTRLSAARSVPRFALASLMTLAVVSQIGVVYEILARGSILTELAAARSVEPPAPGSLQVFASDAPRIYMLMNDLEPASPYLFVYDTNRDLVTWDSYMDRMAGSPPDYVAVEDGFAAQEYGQSRSKTLVNAASVKSWIEQQGYAQFAVGPSLGLTVYQRRRS
jgi:hypothetical protein